jgi:hypothetical protein
MSHARNCAARTPKIKIRLYAAHCYVFGFDVRGYPIVHGISVFHDMLLCLCCSVHALISSSTQKTRYPMEIIEVYDFDFVKLFLE